MKFSPTIFSLNLFKLFIFTFLFVVVFPQSIYAAVCFNDIALFNNPVCTANDVTTANIHVLSGPSTCVNGTTMHLRLQAETVAGSNIRYDIGYWFALDGGNAKNGTCYQDYLPPPLNTTAASSTTRSSPYYNAETGSDSLDSCGDIEQNITNIRNIGASILSGGGEGAPAVLTMPCQDKNNDNIADVALCTTWDNQSGTSPSCTSAIMTVPGTPSKCRCVTISLGQITYQAFCETDFDCNDNNSCTSDTCDPESRRCINTSNLIGTGCDDGDPCTNNDVCVGLSQTECVGTPAICVALDQCHDIGSCDFSNGCTNPNKTDGSPCIDGLFCTSPDTCLDGICTGQNTCGDNQTCEIDGCTGQPSECEADSDCNDQNLCTNDRCSESICLHDNNNAPCNDGNACTTNDHCANGSCTGGAQLPCNEPGVCQVSPGTCTNGACNYQTADDGTSCGVKRSCQSGLCQTAGDCEKASDCPSITCLSAQCTGGSCTYDSVTSDGKACGNGGTCHQSICAECDQSSPCSEANFCNLATCTR